MRWRTQAAYLGRAVRFSRVDLAGVFAELCGEALSVVAADLEGDIRAALPKSPLISLRFPTSATSSVQVAIWENDQEKNDEHFATHSSTVQRRYRDGNEWKSIQRFRASDLQMISLADCLGSVPSTHGGKTEVMKPSGFRKGLPIPAHTELGSFSNCDVFTQLTLANETDFARSCSRLSVRIWYDAIRCIGRCD